MEATDTITLERKTSSNGAWASASNVRAVIPKLLGSVQLIHEIGRGGMGVVWLGRDKMLGRDVAVKFLLNAITSKDDPDFARFLEGARAAAAASWYIALLIVVERCLRQFARRLRRLMEELTIKGSLKVESTLPQ